MGLNRRVTEIIHSLKRSVKRGLHHLACESRSVSAFVSPADSEKRTLFSAGETREQKKGSALTCT